MTEQLPDKIIRFDPLKVNRDIKKLCRCIDPAYEIDQRNRLVYCQTCGAIVDPFEALLHIARKHESYERLAREMLEQRRQIANYHPRRMIIKRLEEHYCRNKNLLPCCPHCEKPFDFNQIQRWITQEFYKFQEGRDDD